MFLLLNIDTLSILLSLSLQGQFVPSHSHMEKTTPLYEAVLKTIALFDVLDFAGTSDEIHYYLYGGNQNVTLAEIEYVLENLEPVEKIENWYVMKGREKLALLRVEKMEWSKKYWDRARKWKWVFRLVPFLKKVYVCNNLAFNNVLQKSDIDLFIVTQKDRMFLARSILTFLCHILGIRRHGEKIAGRFCLSFWASEDAENFTSFALPEDPYLSLWHKSLVPIYESKAAVSPSEKNLNDTLENWIAGWQIKRIEEKRVRLSDPSGILATKKMLKFHDRDRRQEFYEAWKKRVTAYSAPGADK